MAMIVRPKNILLFEHMLAASSYPDMDLVKELREGTGLVGVVPKTGLWPSRFQPASITLEELHDVARLERGGLQDQCAGFSESGLVDEVWRKTMDEVRTGVLEGPIDLQDSNVECPLSQRFGIEREAIRYVALMTSAGINSSVQTCESPKPHTIVFASLCVYLMTHFKELQNCVGRTFDLVGAYRQMCSEAKLQEVFFHHGATARQSRNLWLSDACTSFWIGKICPCFPAHLAQPLVYTGETDEGAPITLTIS